MLIDKDISIHLSCQQFECDRLEINSDNSTLSFVSRRSSSDEVCPHCGGKKETDAVVRGGAKASGIPALVRFAELKEKRLDGLVAHARHNISTGRQEGFNNKIKVAKRIGYGYRNEGYFFTIIRYMSIPAVRTQSPKKT